MLMDWIGYQANVAKPLDRDGVNSLIFDLSGVVLGINWINWFEQHHPEIRASWPGNLDPKCTQNFNPTNIVYFYKLLKDVNTAFPNPPPEQIGNMNKKGFKFGEG